MPDEKEINRLYVENMELAFDGFLEQGNIEKCREIVELVRPIDQLAANALIDDLYNTSIGTFMGQADYSTGEMAIPPMDPGEMGYRRTYDK